MDVNSARKRSPCATSWLPVLHFRRIRIDRQEYVDSAAANSCASSAFPMRILHSRERRLYQA